MGGNPRPCYRRQPDEEIVPSWTDLTGLPTWVPDWGSLSAGERRLFARYMEVFAGFVTHTDAQLGRFLGFLDDRGNLDNTMVVVLRTTAPVPKLSDGNVNEPNAWMAQLEAVEAPGPYRRARGTSCLQPLSTGWAWAGNAPFQLWKRYAWLGGTRTPLIVHWPGHTTRGPAVCDRSSAMRSICSPTVLDAAGHRGAHGRRWCEPTANRRDEHRLHVLRPLEQRSPRDTRNYSRCTDHGGISHDGWKATTDYVSPLFGERSHLE